MFCIHGENPREYAKPPEPQPNPRAGVVSRTACGAHTSSASVVHMERLASAALKWCTDGRFPEAAAAKSLTPCVDSSESDLSLLRGLDPPKLSYPNMNFLFDRLCSGNVSPSSSTHPALTSFLLGSEASSAWGKYVNYVGNSPLSINSSLKLHIG